MTVPERIFDGKLVPLPAEAGDVNAPRFDPVDSWLRTAPAIQQKAAMWRWFATRYEDPQVATPHDDQGNYVFTDGGPFRADEVLHERFDRCVVPEVVQELVGDVQAEVGNDWALRRLDKSGS